MFNIILIGFGLFIFISNPGTPTFGILLGTIASVVWMNRSQGKHEERMKEHEEALIAENEESTDPESKVEKD